MAKFCVEVSNVIC